METGLPASRLANLAGDWGLIMGDLATQWADEGTELSAVNTLETRRRGRRRPKARPSTMSARVTDRRIPSAPESGLK